MAGVWETARRLPPLGTGSRPALYVGHKHNQSHTVHAPVRNVCITAKLYIQGISVEKQTKKSIAYSSILEPP